MFFEETCSQLAMPTVSTLRVPEAWILDQNGQSQLNPPYEPPSPQSWSPCLPASNIGRPRTHP